MTDIRKAGLILAACVGLGGNTAPSSPPVYLDATREGEMLRLQVIGHTEHRVNGHYTLEVISAASNRSRQSGTIHLVPDSDATIATVRIGYQDGQDLTATLNVTLDGMSPYELRYDTAGMSEG